MQGVGGMLCKSDKPSIIIIIKVLVVMMVCVCVGGGGVHRVDLCGDEGTHVGLVTYITRNMLHTWHTSSTLNLKS